MYLIKITLYIKEFNLYNFHINLMKKNFILKY